MRFSFIDAEKARHPVRTLCKVLDVSESGYHAWRKRPESKRAGDNRRLAAHIRAEFARSDETYGSPRIKQELDANGNAAGRHRIAKIMQQEGIKARKPKRFKKTTDSNHESPIAPNLVARRFDEIASAPNKLWVSDLTYIWTWQGWIYLATVIDVFSRKVVGWAVQDSMETTIINDALAMALARRLPPPGLIFHSDRGSQYASNDFRSRLAANNIVQSMSRKGDCWDNAIAESFFATIKTELIDRRSWATHNQVTDAVHTWIECFYNGRRRHSSLGYASPIDYEALTREASAA